MSSKKIRVAVLYGGRSGEHEISLRSAASVIRFLDKSRFDVVPVAIDKEGRWHLNDVKLIEEAAHNSSLPVITDVPGPNEVLLPPNPQVGASSLLSLGGASSSPAPQSAPQSSFDVVFPVMHGSMGEDGTIQGLLELADVPYVGAGVLGSAVAMDKGVAKRLVRDAGLPVVPWVEVKDGEWKRAPARISARVASELGFPCFAKPANLGSSVGVHKVKSAAALKAAMDDAFRYDRKVLVEKAVAAREIEVAILENIDEGAPPLASIAGEITPSSHHEFYSYESKYLDENGAALLIPAKLDFNQMKQIQQLAREAFVALECEGMARVDFFLDRDTGELFFNELNSIPGFTSISMYPKMWEASGLGYADLLTKLIELALARQERKSRLVRDFHAK